MKRIIILNFLLLTLSVLTMSCSPRFDGDEEKAKNAFIKSHGIKPELLSFSEIKLIRNVTVEDSINYFLGATGEIIKAHDETLKKLNDWVALKQKEANSYSQWNHDSYIEKFTNEANRFTDAFEGRFSDDSWAYDYTYRKLYRLRQMDRNKVIGKIYSITYTLNKKTQTQTWCFDVDITSTIGGALDEESIKKPSPGELDKIHFRRYDLSSHNKEKETHKIEFIHEGGEIEEFDENGNPVK